MMPSNPFDALRAALGLGPKTKWADSEHTALADWAASIEWEVVPFPLTDPSWALYDGFEANDPPIAIFRHREDAERVAAILRDYGGLD